MTNHVVRDQLIIMLNWKVGILTEWSVSTGKSSKYLYKWISEKEWKMFLSTYFDGNVDNAWKSVFGIEVWHSLLGRTLDGNIMKMREKLLMIF